MTERPTDQDIRDALAEQNWSYCATCNKLLGKSRTIYPGFPGEYHPNCPPPFQTKIKEKNEIVNHPKHYKSHPSGIECIQIVEHMSFLRGNAMKYLWRADHKNGLEDLRKAAWYLQREIANMEKRSVQENGGTMATETESD